MFILNSHFHFIRIHLIKRTPLPTELPMTNPIFPQFLLDFETGHVVQYIFFVYFILLLLNAGDIK